MFREGEASASPDDETGRHKVSKWQDVNGIPVDEAGRYDAALIDWVALESLPTLAVGQADDLKIDTGRQRVWLARTEMADGEHCDHHVTVEAFDGDRWFNESEN